MINTKRKERVKLSAEAIRLFSDDKEKTAELFQKEQPFMYDKSGLFWLWNKEEYKWEMLDEYDLLNILKKRLDPSANLIKNKTWTEIIRAMKLVGRRYQAEPFKKHWVQFHDTILDLKTNKKIQATSRYFNVNPIPYKLSERTETPKINKILRQWVGKDYIKTVKEIIAYCMLQDYPLHRIFCFIGAGMNGKGECLRLIKRIIGHENVCSTELDFIIHGRFETAKLYKKLVCMMGETNFNEMSKTSILKRLTGGDLIGIEFKNKNPFDTTNYAKLLISTNSLPPTTDKTIGFYRRWLILDFPNTFTEGKDVLGKISDQEISNLCTQIIPVLKKLLKKGTFHNDGTLEERKQRYELKSNPMPEFINKNYKKVGSSEVPFHEFRDNFLAYLKERGFRELSSTMIGNQLKSDGFEIIKKDVNTGEKWTRWRYIIGLQSKQETKEQEIEQKQDLSSTIYKTENIK